MLRRAWNRISPITTEAYTEVVEEHAEAADVSDFVSTVMVQVKKTAVEAASGADSEAATDPDDTSNEDPHILVTDLPIIEAGTFWDTYEGYFELGGPTANDDVVEKDPGAPGSSRNVVQALAKEDGKLNQLQQEVAQLKKQQKQMLEVNLRNEEMLKLLVASTDSSTTE